jgi:hypothetical protein
VADLLLMGAAAVVTGAFLLLLLGVAMLLDRRTPDDHDPLDR